MEQLNYHKLINLKKRFEKYDCEYSKKILATVDECIEDAKEVSKKKDKDRRDTYEYEDVVCDECGKKYPRKNIYRHKNDIHGAVSSKSKKESRVDAVLAQIVADIKAIKEAEIKAGVYDEKDYVDFSGI